MQWGAGSRFRASEGPITAFCLDGCFRGVNRAPSIRTPGLTEDITSFLCEYGTRKDVKRPRMLFTLTATALTAAVGDASQFASDG